MNRLNAAMAIIVASSALFCANIQAAVPQVINYQGRLTDGGGAPVADGAQLVKFVIYDAPVGGAVLWDAGFQNVTTENGFFTYALGSNAPLPDDLFSDTSRYLGITVGVDPELSPRSRLESSPYAYHALRADTALSAPSSIGITQRFEEGNSIVTGFFNFLGSDSINCPTDGYVLMNVSLDMNCNHTAGDEDVVFVFLLEAGPIAVLQDQDSRAWSVPSSLPTSQYSTLIGLHKVFPVSAGWNEFEALGFQNAGGGTDNFAESDVTVSLLFIPQAFGTVEVGVPTPPSSPLNNIQLKQE